MISRRTFLVAASAVPAVALMPQAALAAKPAVYALDGIAINGIDPLGYFQESAPVPGSAQWSLMWMGATWHFASEANRAAFETDPDRFAPKYGGYCAYAVSKGATAPTDPEAWTIHEDRLFLNFSPSVRTIWREDIPGNVARADANWPDVLQA
jgi:YHS domain-containing protein